MLAALHQLPEMDRTVLLMRALDEMPHEEIAETLPICDDITGHLHGALLIRHIMWCMIRRILVMMLAGVALLLAADPSGTWNGDQPGRDGNTYNITFKLKADGAKLTGTMGGDQFEQPIQNGEIHGDDISFTVHLEFGDGIDLKYTGKVAADKIDFKVQRTGDDRAQPFVAKKTQ